MRAAAACLPSTPLPSARETLLRLLEAGEKKKRRKRERKAFRLPPARPSQASGGRLGWREARGPLTAPVAEPLTRHPPRISPSPQGVAVAPPALGGERLPSP